MKSITIIHQVSSPLPSSAPLQNREKVINNKLLLTKYRFTLETIDNITLPAYKGSTFHGGFGHALMKISPTWYRYFFEPGLNKKGDWPKPFIILPPLDELESYPQGHQFHCELTLFGEATQHYAIAHAAIEYLGMEMGLGYEQGKYKVIHIETSQPLLQDKKNTQQISLHLPTRLRLKANNRLQRQAPDFQLIILRLLGRITTLEKAYMGKKPDHEKHQNLISLANNIHTESSKMKWDDWDRFSGSQKKPNATPMDDSYDTSDAKIRRQISKRLENHGTRIQYSVFECRLNHKQQTYYSTLSSPNYTKPCTIKNKHPSA